VKSVVAREVCLDKPELKLLGHTNSENPN